MIKKEDIIADFHIHTIGSKHAYSTLKECIDCAKEQGMKFIAITDHYYNDGTELEKKNEVNRLRYLERQASSTSSNIKVIGGAEFNLFQNIPDWDKLKNEMETHRCTLFLTLTLDTVYTFKIDPLLP